MTAERSNTKTMCVWTDLMAGIELSLCVKELFWIVLVYR